MDSWLSEFLELPEGYLLELTILDFTLLADRQVSCIGGQDYFFALRVHAQEEKAAGQVGGQVLWWRLSSAE